MSKIHTDVDIDFKDRLKALEVLPHIPALMINNGREMRHNTGIYFHDIPVNPLTDIASIPYDTAEDYGYFKIDFINNSVYEGVRDADHLDRLVSQEPEWSLLDDQAVVSLFAHIHDHFGIVNTIKPKSIEDLAIVLAIIRPGKRYLLGKDMATIRNEVWIPPQDGTYHFKKSHATAYALSIVVQMNLLVESVM